MADPLSSTPLTSGHNSDTMMMELIEELFPICRSITGDGVRRTLEIVGRRIPIQIHEVPSGTEVLDWTIPDEWNIRDAWIGDDDGNRIVDFAESNLHVVSYSVPVRRRVPLQELRRHLHVHPDLPHSIPYRTSYYERDWGFCVTQAQYDALTHAEYEVCIDSSLEPGSLSYGELVLPGTSEDEILISSHVCHPSLANDNLSGIAVSVALAAALAEEQRRYTYRFVYAPGTIGAITWLARNRERAERVRHGLTLVCLGDAADLTYKRTFSATAEIDRVAEHVLQTTSTTGKAIDFFPYGYDERQYNSPGFRLPVGSLMRGRHGQFLEYHSSADNLGFISAEQIDESYSVVRRIVDVLDRNRTFRNLQPHAEPQLGKRGLYGAIGGRANVAEVQLAMLWVLSCSDGAYSLLDIAERAKLPFEIVAETADLLVRHELLEEVSHR